jgi:hypothetical protein
MNTVATVNVPYYGMPSLAQTLIASCSIKFSLRKLSVVRIQNLLFSIDHEEYLPIQGEKNKALNGTAAGQVYMLRFDCVSPPDPISMHPSRWQKASSCLLTGTYSFVPAV